MDSEKIASEAIRLVYKYNNSDALYDERDKIISSYTKSHRIKYAKYILGGIILLTIGFILLFFTDGRITGNFSYIIIPTATFLTILNIIGFFVNNEADNIYNDAYKNFNNYKKIINNKK